MNNVLKKVFTTLAIGYIFGFLFLYCYSLVTFSPKTVMEQYFWKSVFDNTCILFITAVIPITAATLIASYSLFLSPGEIRGISTKSVTSFSTIIKSILPILIIFLIVYVLLAEAMLPGIYTRRQEMVYFTERANVLEKSIEKYIGADDWKNAGDALEEYLSIDRDNKKMLNLYDTVTRRLQQSSEKTGGIPEFSMGTKPPAPMDATELIGEALSFYNHQDFYSAHYYSSLALKLDSSRTEAKRIMAMAWEKITAPRPGHENEAARLLYEKKREGYEALIRDDMITAYAVFSSLKTVYPYDRDVEEYLKKSADGLERISFFIDEVSNITILEGKREIFFRNQKTQEFSEFIYMKKLIRKNGEYYIENLEAIAFDKNGTIRYHLTAPYGKIVGRLIMLHAVGRDNPGIQIIPEYAAGSRERAFTNSITLETSPEYLYGLSTTKNTIKTLNIAQLYKLSSDYDRFGYRKETAQLELLERMMLYFNFVIFSFLSIGLGWFLRSRYHNRIPILMYGFIPFLPFAMHYFIQILFYGQKIFTGFFLLTSGFMYGAVSFVLIEFFLLFGSLLFLSGQVIGNE